MSAKNVIPPPEKVHNLLDRIQERPSQEERNNLIDQFFKVFLQIAEPVSGSLDQLSVGTVASPAGSAAALSKTSMKTASPVVVSQPSPATAPVPPPVSKVATKTTADVKSLQVPQGVKPVTAAPATAPVTKVAPLPSARVDEAAPIVKRGRGRPRKNPLPESAESEEGARYMKLADFFGVTDSRLRKALINIATQARSEVGGRGIPMTEEGKENSYKLERRGGPKPITRAYVIDGVHFEVEPPIETKIPEPRGKLINGMWVEFEMILLGISDGRLPVAETQKRQTAIAFDPGVQAAKINWVEGKLSDGAEGIPTIQAETARDILRQVPEIAQLGDDFLARAPAAWLTPEGVFTDQFSTLMRDVYYDRTVLGRRERFALARLLLEPLGSIERRIYEIAFDERFEDKAFAESQHQAAVAAGAPVRGRPKGSTNKTKDAAKAGSAKTKPLYSTSAKGKKPATAAKPSGLGAKIKAKLTKAAKAHEQSGKAGKTKIRAKG